MKESSDKERDKDLYKDKKETKGNLDEVDNNLQMYLEGRYPPLK